jgi:hypothetical protein
MKAALSCVAFFGGTIWGVVALVIFCYLLSTWNEQRTQATALNF